jgi:N-acetylmuramoyl-L-alanine amidase CwlA
MIRDRLLSVNFTEGRGGMRPDLVVIHVTEGSAASVRDWFTRPVAQVSAHYMVCRDGTIDRFVDEADTAWHAGRVYEATASLVTERPGVNPNRYSIGVEHEGTGTSPLTAAQRTASLALVGDICRRWLIPVERRHIVGHREVYAKKTCPGAINVDAFVLELRALESPAGKPRRPAIVWSAYANDYLVVTRVVTDAEWYFVPMKTVGRVPVTRATVPLSSMPLVAP